VNAMIPHNAYYERLGVAPSVTIDELNTAYYLALERFPEHPTEEQAEEQQQLQHAYAVLRKVVGSRRPTRRPWIAAGVPLALGAVGFAALAALALLVLNLGTLKLKLTHFEPGDVLRFEAHEVSYGEVVGYESKHRFSSGSPAPAYQLRRTDGSDEVIWLSERVVEQGMVRVEGPEVETASAP